MLLMRKLRLTKIKEVAQDHYTKKDDIEVCMQVCGFNKQTVHTQKNYI